MGRTKSGGRRSGDRYKVSFGERAPRPRAFIDDPTRRAGTERTTEMPVWGSYGMGALSPARCSGLS